MLILLVFEDCSHEVNQLTSFDGDRLVVLHKLIQFLIMHTLLNSITLEIFNQIEDFDVATLFYVEQNHNLFDFANKFYFSRHFLRALIALIELVEIRF